MISSSIRLTLAIFIVAGTLIVSNNLVSAQCGANVPELIAQCSQFVQPGGPQKPPSSGCCQVVKPIDVPCACKLIGNNENLVDPKKVVYVARYCGLTVQPGMKCGSFIVPNA